MKYKDRVYNGVWSEWQGVLDDFRYSIPKDMPEPKLFWGTYDCADYEGYAFLVYKEGRKWFHVSGSHCSCYGLEDQWSPEEFKAADYWKAKKTGKDLISENYYGGNTEGFEKWFKQKSAPKKRKTESQASV